MVTGTRQLLHSHALEVELAHSHRDTHCKNKTATARCMGTKCALFAAETTDLIGAATAERSAMQFTDPIATKPSCVVQTMWLSRWPVGIG
jgi:hypothetical protein